MLSMGCPKFDHGLKVKEVTSRSALSVSNLEGLDYSLNPYRGCGQSCLYCYSPFLLREERDWGTFVDVRRNIPQVLSKELKGKVIGEVGISTVTDPYQAIEEELEVTRRCLEVLLRKKWPISIQTKSALVGRDLDILKRFTKRDVGMTITSGDDEIRRLYEPKTSPIDEQFEALEELSKAGIYSWVYMGPIVPFVTEDSLDGIVKRCAQVGVRCIMVDALRARGRAWERMVGFYEIWRPELVDEFKALRLKGGPYFNKVAQKIKKACHREGLECISYVGRDRL